MRQFRLSYFRPCMRAMAWLFLVAITAGYLVPSAIVADFYVERDRIARDLCVQRMVKEGMRTCHGDCYVMKKLRHLEQKERDLPGELRDLRIDEALPASKVVMWMVQDMAPGRPRCSADGGMLAGHSRSLEPVPWC